LGARGKPVQRARPSQSPDAGVGPTAAVLAAWPMLVYCSATQCRPAAPLPKNSAMIELLSFISYVITLYTYVIIAAVIVSWLIAFNVINGHNSFVRSLWQGLNALTEPLLKPIRSMLPSMGGLDISPIILLLGCYFVQTVILPNIAKLVR
jgi:YggT family protein